MKVPILTYHALGAADSVLFTRVETFRRHMEKLAQWGYQTVRLEDLEPVLRQTRDDHPRVVITFDDAYVSVRQQAAPILERLGFSATIFAPTAACGHLPNWKGAAGETMSWAELSELVDRGFELGSHSVDHLDLTRISRQQAEFQLRESQKEIERQLRRPCRAFAYPYGRVDSGARVLAGRYYSVAVTTRLRWASPRDDLLCLPRVEMYYFRNLRLWEHFHDRLGRAYLGFRRAPRRWRGR